MDLKEEIALLERKLELLKLLKQAQDQIGQPQCAVSGLYGTTYGIIARK